MPTPKVARNLGTLTFHRYRENRRISTIRFQTLKYTQGNYVRHFWGTTPATPAARDGQHNSTRGATPVTRHYTPYEALHPLRGTAPDQKGCNAYGSGAAPPITRTNAESARRGPGCGARGRWRGLAGQRTNNEPDRLEAAAGPAGPGRATHKQRARPIGGRRGACGAWPGFEPTRRAKLAARTASGRAGHAAAGDLSRQRATRSRPAPSGPGGTRVRRQLSEAAQLSRRSRWRRRGRPRR